MIDLMYNIKNRQAYVWCCNPPNAGILSTGIYNWFESTSSELKLTSRTTNLLPASISSCDNVCGNVGNVVIRKTSAESRHGVLSVGDLGDDRFLGAATSKVLIKGLLLKSLLWHNHVLSSSVARSAIRVEDLFSGTDISGKSWGSKSEGDGTNSGSL